MQIDKQWETALFLALCIAIGSYVVSIGGDAPRTFLKITAALFALVVIGNRLERWQWRRFYKSITGKEDAES